MKILVTGAAGFIGSHLVDRLVARGDEVVGIDNFDPFYAPHEKRRNIAGALQSGRFRLLEVDVVEGAAVREALKGTRVDVMVHLAAKAGVQPSVRDPAGYARVNVLGTQVMLDAARDLSVGRVVFGSSSSVYGNAARLPFGEDDAAIQPVSPYAATKRAAELLCSAHQHLHGGSMVCLRFFTVYGPRQRPDLAIRKFCTFLSQGRPIPMFGDGATARDYTWIDDIMAGVVGAIDRGSREPKEFQIINVGGSKPVELRYLVSLIGEAMGVRPVIDQLPPQAGDVDKTWADVSKARRLLGYDPHTTIEEGIRRFVAWFSESRGGVTTPPA